MIAGATAPSRLTGDTAARLPTGADAERIVDIVSGPLQVRLAESAADIDAAQALRYRIFYEIMGARPLPGMAQQRRDCDRYDQICDHLLVLDHSRGRGAEAVVGTYRLIRREAAARFGAFYSAAEYDIARADRLSRRNSRTRPLLRRCRIPRAARHAVVVERHRRLCLPLRHRADVRLREPAGHRPGRAGGAALLPLPPPPGAAGTAGAGLAGALCRYAPARSRGARPGAHAGGACRR